MVNEPTTQVRNIYQRLNAVMAELAYVQKGKMVGKESSSSKYMAVTHDQVAALTHPLFVKHGIVVVPAVRESSIRVSDAGKTSSGTPIIRFEAVYDVAFRNIDEPMECAVVTVPAHANDQGDKAPGKATSYAVKGAKLKILDLETGEDDEERVDGGGDSLSNERVIELESLFKKETDKARLGELARSAMAEAEQAGDKYAFKRLKDAAVKRADELDLAPRDREIEEVLSPAPAAKRPEPADIKLATDGMRKTVASAMKRTGKVEHELRTKFGFDLDAIPMDKTNEVLTWARSS